MKDIWDKPITADTDWGGDASTGGLPVSGKIVQEYIKSRLKTDDQLKAFIKAYLDENGMSENQGYVTLATEQTIKAIKDFEAGLKIGGSLITYDKDLNAFILRANLVTEGGITARALLDEVDVPTFMDALVVDESFIVDNGVLRLNPNLDLGGLDTEELENYLAANKYATITDISSALKPYITSEFVEKTYSTIKYVDETFVRLAGELQTISARHDFTDGLKVGGLPIYKSIDDTIYIDANVVVRGGITARGTNTTQSPSIFEALPIDGDTIKRTTDGRLYVDADALNISGGGGVADSVSWENVPGKPSWIGSTKPTYTPQEIGALPITGGTVNGLVQATSFSASEWMSARFFTSDSFPVSANTTGVCRWGTFDEVGGLKIQFGADSDTKIEVVNRQWSKSLFSIDTSGNVTAAGNMAIGGTTASARLDVTTTSGWCTSFKNTNAIVAASHRDGHGIFIGSTMPTTSSNYLFRVWQGSLTGASGTGKELFSVNSNGATNVGGKLYVGTSSDSHIYLQRNGTNYIDANGSLRFTVSGYSTTAMEITTSGNVAIGGASGSEKLHVNGNILAAGGITARYTSDMRLKQNRRSFKASEVLMSLGAVQQFEYIPSEVEKNKMYEGTHIGLIYQNVVGTALNRMCHEREDGYGSLNYLEPSFISLLAGVGQEHEVRIQQLERENKTLKEEVEKLRKRVA